MGVAAGRDAGLIARAEWAGPSAARALSHRTSRNDLLLDDELARHRAQVPRGGAEELVGIAGFQLAAGQRRAGCLTAADDLRERNHPGVASLDVIRRQAGCHSVLRDSLVCIGRCDDYVVAHRLRWQLA